ncbi:hypothetical protein HK104_007522 [Borealophlyctis nickersoniae]|nr:hypothetical protein HK104_007522 [Borealophlyctis nickersoniae]
MHSNKSTSTLSLLLFLVLAGLVADTTAQAWSNGVRCTYHDYEGDKSRLGTSYDDSPGWCGYRYSVLDVSRITAVSGMDVALCGKCLEISGANGGPSTYVMAVDQKGDPGLDVARTSFAKTFPGSNPLDPQSCRYRVVSDDYCAGICNGAECKPGVRNYLPAYLLPAAGSSGASQQTQTQTQTQSQPQQQAQAQVQSQSQSQSQPQPQTLDGFPICSTAPSTVGCALSKAYGFESGHSCRAPTKDADCAQLWIPNQQKIEAAAATAPSTQAYLPRVGAFSSDASAVSASWMGLAGLAVFVGLIVA